MKVTLNIPDYKKRIEKIEKNLKNPINDDISPRTRIIVWIAGGILVFLNFITLYFK